MPRLAEMAVVEGRYEFPERVFFRGSCLALEAPFALDGQDGTIGLPTAELAPDSEARPDLLAPPLADQTVLGAIPDLSWGYIGDPKEGHFAAERCYVRIRAEYAPGELEESSKRLAYLIRPWFYRVIEWIEVLTGQDLYEHERPYTEREQRPYGSFYLFDGETYTNVTRQEGIWMNPWPLEESLTPEKWRFCLAAASKQDRPPLELLVMRDANAALMRGHYRKAVVDAGSAVEIALNRRIRQTLASANEAYVVEELLRSHPTLGRKLALAKRLGLEVPEDAQKELVEPRNRTVHRGETPDALAAGVAVHVAGDVVGKKDTTSM